MRKVCFQFGKSTIDYAIVRYDRRSTVRIEVSGQKGVIVRLPPDCSDAVASEAVERKAAWIHQRLALLSELPPAPSPKEYVSGETFLYLGRQYRLKIEMVPGCSVSVKLLGRYLTVEIPETVTPDEGRGRCIRALERWYREHARSKAAERVKQYAGRLGASFACTHICSQQRRWGSCSTDGTLRLNWRIVMAPLPLFDYVIAHELCHLLERNHTRRFWGLLESVMPDCHARRPRLRQIGAQLQATSTAGGA